MKARRVTVSLEIESRIPMNELKRRQWWNDLLRDAEDEDGKVIEVVQVQANVIQKGR